MSMVLDEHLRSIIAIGVTHATAASSYEIFGTRYSAAPEISKARSSPPRVPG